MAKILLVDDETNILKAMSSILQDEGHIIYPCECGNNALDFLKKNKVDIIFLDVWLPDIDGIEVLERIKQMNPEVAVIMISGHGSIDIAVKSTKLGAFDFLEKPPSMERVLTSLNNALEQIRLKKENIRLRKEVQCGDKIVGVSEGIHEVEKIIAKAAATNARVLITGNSGTGKELVAKSIFKNSKRSEKPFIKVNCAAIPDELIESELFGHEKGSFTGAANRRLGKFDMSDGGTLFLDEICDMSANAQAKVLRVLQEQQFERVGGNETITVDVRIISATNVDIRKAVSEGRFREDLYYRLNVIPIHIPTLTERKKDIPLLVNYFVDNFSRDHGLRTKEISKNGMGFFIKHTWPGNVRELKNIIERLCIMIPKDMIDIDDIEKYIDSYDYEDVAARGISSLKRAREEFEKEYIIQALKENDNNISVTAKILGIERTNLHRKIKQYVIDVEQI